MCRRVPRRFQLEFPRSSGQVKACLFILSYLLIIPYIRISDPGIISSPVTTGKSEFELTEKFSCGTGFTQNFTPRDLSLASISPVTFISLKTQKEMIHIYHNPQVAVSDTDAETGVKTRILFGLMRISDFCFSNHQHKAENSLPGRFFFFSLRKVQNCPVNVTYGDNISDF